MSHGPLHNNTPHAKSTSLGTRCPPICTNTRPSPTYLSYDMVDSVRVLHHRRHEELALEPLEHLRPLRILPRTGRISGRRRPPVGSPYGGRVCRRCRREGRGVALDSGRGGVSTGHVTTASAINRTTATAAGLVHGRYLYGQAIRCRRRHGRRRDGTTTRVVADLPGKRRRKVGSSRTRSGSVGRRAQGGRLTGTGQVQKVGNGRPGAADGHQGGTVGSLCEGTSCSSDGLDSGEHWHQHHAPRSRCTGERRRGGGVPGLPGWVSIPLCQERHENSHSEKRGATKRWKDQPPRPSWATLRAAEVHGWRRVSPSRHPACHLPRP